ncbi:hypothetical protein NIASO_11870 [Niabella soli DSM 19437]|uniref:Uncharacterized protein n=1 Tax=Niabella soli DSM 19437 TaxID=929713 RepID=W0F8A0_9BACT|nr:hypothetical protein NIASO_11870 [Niabella soli DSM 19437]
MRNAKRAMHAAKKSVQISEKDRRKSAGKLYRMGSESKNLLP